MTTEQIESAAEAAETVADDSATNNWEDLSAGTPGQDDEGDDSVAPAASTAAAEEEGSTTDSSEDSSDAEAATAAASSEASTETDPETEATTDDPAAPAPVIPETEKQVELTPEQKAERQAAYDKWVEEQTATLTGEYQLSEEDAERIQTEPELVIPQVMAKMHLNMQRSIMEGLRQVLPQILGSTQAQTQRETQAKDTFYARWPELKVHHDKVIELGKVYRQMNPKATPDKAVEAIGLMVSQALDIKTVPRKEAAPAGGKQSVAKPVRPGSAGSKPPAKAEKSQWDALLDD